MSILLILYYDIFLFINSRRKLFIQVTKFFIGEQMKVKSNRQNYELYHRGFYGNRLRIWNSYDEILQDKYDRRGSRLCLLWWRRSYAGNRMSFDRPKATIEQAYGLFEGTLEDFRTITILSYTPQAEALYRQWRGQRIRLSTHDLRIAAICGSQSATLISRNRRDLGSVPGLAVEFWG